MTKLREITTGLRFPEGPVAMSDGSVLLVEIERGRSMALELAPHGITVNCVAPGPIETEFFTGANDPASPATRALAEAVPLGRLGRPEEVAGVVLFFLSADAGFITGQTLYVCGGLTIGAAPE